MIPFVNDAILVPTAQTYSIWRKQVHLFIDKFPQ